MKGLINAFKPVLANKYTTFYQCGIASLQDRKKENEQVISQLYV